MGIKKLFMILIVFLPVFLQSMSDDEDDYDPFRYVKLLSKSEEEQLENDLHKAVDSCNLQQIEYLFEIGAREIEPFDALACQLLSDALENNDPKSLAVVELLLKKGVGNRYVENDFRFFEIVLEADLLCYEEKKAKALALADAGIWIDFNALRNIVAAKKEEAEDDTLQPHELAETGGLVPSGMTRKEWGLLEQIIDGPRWRAELPAILQDFVPAQLALQEFVPVAPLALLIGRYAHPYYDSKEYDAQDCPDLAAEQDGFSLPQLQAAAGDGEWDGRKPDIAVGQYRREPQRKKLKVVR